MSERVLALVLRAYDDTAPVTVPAPPWPFGLAPFGGDWPNGFSFRGATGKTYLADVGYTSRPTDQPADTYFEPRLVVAIRHSARIMDDGEPEPSGRGRSSAGDITIANGDGALDSILRQGIDGKDLEILRGTQDAAFADFERVFRGTMDAMTWDEERISISLRDRSELLERPLVRRTYGGTGRYDGHAEIKGMQAPLAWGWLNNVAPLLIDPTWLVYQLHDGPIHRVDAVRDRGAPLSAAGDSSDLYAETIAPGAYMTDLGRGLIRLGASADGVVTAALRGDSEGGFVSRTHDIVRRIVTARLGVANLTAGDIDEASFVTLAAERPGLIGFHVPAVEDPSAAEVLDRLLSMAGAAWHVGMDGRLRVTVLSEATDGAEIDPARIETLERRPRGRPSWSRRVGYNRQWRVQAADELVAPPAISEDARSTYSSEWRYAVAETASIQTKHRLARSVEMPGYWRLEADAKALALALQALHGRLRDGWRLTLAGADPFDPAWSLGAGVRLTLPRFDLAAGKRFVIVGRDIAVEEDLEEVVLELWG